MWYLVCESTMPDGNDRVDDVLLHFAAQIFGGDLGAVLRGDDHRFDALRRVAHVLHADLALAIGTEEVQHALAADVGKPLHQLVRHHDGQRHQLGGLVAGVAEHQALVAGAAGVHAHGDIGRLRLDQVVHAAGVGNRSRKLASL